MLVSRGDVKSVVEKLSAKGQYGLDVETTGLMEHDSLFSLIIASAEDVYYFNFNTHPEGASPPEFLLDRFHTLQLLDTHVFSNKGSVWFIQNAKFDMRMLAKEGCELTGYVHCTYAIERVLQNNYFGKDAYRLKGLATRRGLAKDEAVDEYISKHKLYTKVSVPGKKKLIELKHFERVPFEIMSKYGLMDGHLHRTIGLAQLEELKNKERARPDGFPSIYPVVENEIKLTKTCFRMERAGICIDKAYVATALEYEMDQIRLAEKEFTNLTGEVFLDSNKPLQKIFDKLGEKYPTTDKGNPSFAADVLEEMSSPVAGLVNKIRHHDKRAGTYYSSFLHYGESGVIHADARQAGTETGRMSYRDPNLQNVPKEDDQEDLLTPYHVRQCFVPRPGHFFYSIDYKQLEYRLMMDYAGEHAIIKRILDGEDFHDAIAKQCGISRKNAKTLNFMIGYGAGAAKVAQTLGISLRQAKELIWTYFGNLPRLEKLFDNVRKAGEARGYIFNWYGRRNYISSRDFSYILPNHLIQGSGADIVKIAMNRIDEEVLPKVKTKLLLQVHDELLFEVPFGEEDVIQPIVAIMESVYKPQNGMILNVSVEHSYKSWGKRDSIKGAPCN